MNMRFFISSSFPVAGLEAALSVLMRAAHRQEARHINALVSGVAMTL
jgi:hypothetical protein